jgi:hypothetical protein
MPRRTTEGTNQKNSYVGNESVARGADVEVPNRHEANKGITMENDYDQESKPYSSGLGG